MENLRVKDIIEKLNIDSNDVLGNLNKTLGPAVTLTNAAGDQFTFCKEKYVNMLSNIHNCVVIVPKLDKPTLLVNNTYILVDNPRLTFLRAMKLVYPSGVKPRIAIGKDVQIGEGTIIGSPGFGCERNEKSELEEFMNIGGVKIGDNVRIGSNSVVDRGTINDTEIGEGTKLDNFVHIAHNCKIGKHCSIAAGCFFGGGTTLGDFSTFATGVVTRNGISIGKNVFVGLGAVVTKDIPNDMTIMGAPAREINEFKRHLKFVRDNA